MTMPIVCKYCEEGHMISEAYSENFRVGRSSLTVNGLQHSRCDFCDSTMTTAEQFEQNAELVRAAEKRSPGYVSPAMLREFREKYGVSQREAGRLVGAGEGAFGKYETGSNLSTPTAKLIRVALAIPAAARMLALEEGITIDSTAAEETWTGGKFVFVRPPQVEGSHTPENDELFAIRHKIADPVAWKKQEGVLAA